MKDIEGPAAEGRRMSTADRRGPPEYRAPEEISLDVASFGVVFVE
jgi:hypothetical protein